MPSEHTNRGARRARLARADLGYGLDGPLPDLLAAVEQRGGADVVVLELPGPIAGAYLDRPGARPLLLVNGLQALARQRFTLAHEFGHFRLGHASVVDELTSIGGYQHDPREVEANAFAAQFLMPREAIAAWSDTHVDGTVTLEHVLVLASRYGVSAPAARYALAGAGARPGCADWERIDAEIEAKLHLEAIRHLNLGVHDDELAAAARSLPRLPPSLRGGAFGELLAGAIDAAELARRAGRPEAAITAMLTELGLDRLLPRMAGRAA